MPIEHKPADPETEEQAREAVRVEIDAKLSLVCAAFTGLPATVTLFPNESEPLHGWVSIEHDLVDHAAGVQICNVSDEAIATLVTKFPIPRDHERIARWLTR